MTRMEAEAEGGLLMDCWWLLLEGGWPEVDGDGIWCGDDVLGAR